MKCVLLAMSLILSFNVFASQETAINCDVPHSDFSTLVTKLVFAKPTEVRGFIGFTHRSGISGYLPYPQNSMKVTSTSTQRIVNTSMQMFGFVLKQVKFPNEIFEVSQQYFDVEFVSDRSTMIGHCIADE